MDESERNRTLRIEIPSSYVTKNDGEIEWSDLSLRNGWSTIPGALSIYWKGSIDLSGYARDYKTFYPSGGVIQEGPQYFLTGGAGTTVYTIVSSVPVNVDNLLLQLAGNAGPGFIGSPGLPTIGFESQNWETVIFAQCETLLINTTLNSATGILQPITVKQSGSLSPTAAEVLYVVKMVLPFGPVPAGITALGVPASRVLLPGTMDQEPELEYMMRLSRSVELANQV
jgi:hypothetical protein